MPFATEWDTAPNPTYDIWTSVNGSEVVPGVLSPLVATGFCEYDYRGLRQLMAEYEGGRKVKLYPPPAANFFGVFGGRLALNNGFSVAAVSVLDADVAQAILQQFFTGASGGERFVVPTTPAERAEAYAAATEQRAEAPARLAEARERFMAERASERYQEDLQSGLRAAWRRWNELYEENMCDILLTHYVVSVAAGEFQVRLAGILVAAGCDPAAVVGLCSGLGEVESSRPATALYDLSRHALARPAVAETLRRDDLAMVIAALAAPPDRSWKAFADRFARFLFEYGYRGQGEADPTNPDWSEQPTFALSQVRSMLDVDPAKSPKALMKEAVARRRSLEKAVRRGLPADLRPAFDEILPTAQHFTRLRELSKATWVLGTRRSRAPYLAMARGLADKGIVERPDDARFIVHDEMKRLAAGRRIDGLTATIAARRVRFAEAERNVLPDNWVGEPDIRRRGRARRTARSLDGLGVSIGDGPVTGTARIIPSAEAGLARDIAVGDVLVAPFTDAPWTPLFIPAGAVVVETGGVLSHAATVAREFGIPAVVMVKDATRLIHDGDMVTVDGAAGTVTISRSA